jgi:hypothetical protein
MSYNIQDMPKETQQAIEFKRLDCLLVNKLNSLSRRVLSVKEVNDWFLSMPESWRLSDDRVQRLKVAINIALNKYN